MPDIQKDSQKIAEHSSALFDVIEGFLLTQGVDPRTAHEQAAKGGALALSLREIVAGIGGGIIVSGSELATAFIGLVGETRKAGQPGLNDVIAAALSEILQIEIPSAGGPFDRTAPDQDQNKRNLGKSLLSSLEKLFVPDGATGQIDGEKAASAMVGFNLTFAVFGAAFSILGEAVSLGFLKEFAELPELVEKSLGLGRLLRQALRPLINNTITKPYERQLRAKYRQDFLPETELCRALLAGRMSESTVRHLLAQKGYPEDQITELIAQHTPGLGAHDIATLKAYGVIDASTASGMLKSEGVPDSIAGWQAQLYDIQRLAPLRHAYANEALQLAQQRFVDPQTLSFILSKSGLPSDEQQLYMNRLGLWLDSEHKRLSKLDMLYLYEHGQVTIDEVETWATEQGYNAQDRLALILEFLSKAGGKTTKTPEQIAQAAAHQHNEHVAFVRDQFQANYQRDPSAAESQGWVSLLDTKSRTKGDAKAEIKANPNPPSL